MNIVIESAEHWEALAAEEEARAVWIVENCPQRGSVQVYYERSKTYRSCARALRLEAATGLPHCMCHEKPTVDCPTEKKRKGL